MQRHMDDPSIQPDDPKHDLAEDQNGLSSESLQAVDVAPKHRPRRGDTQIRFLTLGWCMWLLAGWGITLSIDAIIPAVRWMVFTAAFGLLLVWPAYRLSLASRHLHKRPRRVIGETLLEWISLIIVLQAVIWPLKISAHWSGLQTALLNITFGVWSLLTGLIIAWGCLRNSPGRRLMAMCLVVLLVFGGPLLELVAPKFVAMIAIEMPTGQILPFSPLQSLWSLSNRPSLFSASPFTEILIGITIAATIGWIGLTVITRPHTTTPHSQPNTSANK
ncbi:hypothetical protein [Poriferisphaera sp. WC338]|uniref:hypothetical protein n=1 Tax=Poriferisphaera sp. WC338 TaxID=3425129 RepID=UPI003D817031